MTKGIMRIGGFADGRINFFKAERPLERGNFPSIGARGCFMSHLAIIREAQDRGIEKLLILEDDLDFSSDFCTRGAARINRLIATQWDIFYGAYDLPDSAKLNDDDPVDPRQAILTTSFVALSGRAVARIIPFLEGLLGRPAGSPDYGPMHVDGAYSVFRMLNPEIRTFAAAPPLGYQRSSRSDISDATRFFDRTPGLRDLADIARRARMAVKDRLYLKR